MAEEDFACDPGEVCSDGLCGLSCGGTTPTRCGEACVDTSNNRYHCGGCTTDDEDFACTAGEICTAGACVTTCSACWIVDECYGVGQLSPDNPCQICDPDRSTDGWSANTGASCDDGNFCNGRETCSGEVCSVPGTAPCIDDGFYCNGTEGCDEATDRCTHSGDPCGAGEVCDEGDNECCLDEFTTDCDAEGDWVLLDGCDDVVTVLEDCAADEGCAPDDGCI